MRRGRARVGRLERGREPRRERRLGSEGGRRRGVAAAAQPRRRRRRREVGLRRHRPGQLRPEARDLGVALGELDAQLRRLRRERAAVAASGSRRAAAGRVGAVRRRRQLLLQQPPRGERAGATAAAAALRVREPPLQLLRRARRRGELLLERRDAAVAPRELVAQLDLGARRDAQLALQVGGRHLAAHELARHERERRRRRRLWCPVLGSGACRRRAGALLLLLLGLLDARERRLEALDRCRRHVARILQLARARLELRHAVVQRVALRLEAGGAAFERGALRLELLVGLERHEVRRGVGGGRLELGLARLGAARRGGGLVGQLAPKRVGLGLERRLARGHARLELLSRLLQQQRLAAAAATAAVDSARLAARRRRRRLELRL